MIPGLGSSPREGNGYPLQYSGLEDSMDSIVYGVANSQRQLSDFQMLIVSASCSVVSDSATLWTVDCSVNGVLQARMLA